jgi:ABC-type phosphate transport system auxiliary subunit
MSDENVMIEEISLQEIKNNEEEIPKIEISKKSNPKRLNEQDRIKIIALHLRNKELPEGYSVTEDSKGNFHVKTIRIVSKKDQLLQQKQRFEKKISQIDKEIESLDQNIPVPDENILNKPKKNIKKDIPKKNIPKKEKRVTIINPEVKEEKEDDEELIMINDEGIEEESQIKEPGENKV